MDNEENKEELIQRQREYKVDKSNELIQRARYDLTTLELKTLAFLMSQIKPSDQFGQSYQFKVADYCKVRGIDDQSGRNVELVKSSLKSLHDKSFWMERDNGDIVLCSWIQKPIIHSGTKRGWITVSFDEDVEKHLIGLTEIGGYTQYELISTLPMKSAYSIRLYELLKSFHGKLIYRSQNKHAVVKQEVDLEELRMRIGSNKLSDNGKVIAVHYKSFREFKRNCLDVAIDEINTYTDLIVGYAKITRGRTVTAIQFEMRYKNADEQLLTFKASDKALKADDVPGQMDIFDWQLSKEKELTGQEGK